MNLKNSLGVKILDSQFEVFKILYDKGINLPLYGYKKLYAPKYCP